MIQESQLSYCRGTTQHAISVGIFSTAEQQYEQVAQLSQRGALSQLKSSAAAAAQLYEKSHLTRSIALSFGTKYRR